MFRERLITVFNCRRVELPWYQYMPHISLVQARVSTYTCRCKHSVDQELGTKVITTTGHICKKGLPVQEVVVYIFPLGPNGEKVSQKALILGYSRPVAHIT